MEETAAHLSSERRLRPRVPVGILGGEHIGGPAALLAPATGLNVRHHGRGRFTAGGQTAVLRGGRFLLHRER